MPDVPAKPSKSTDQQPDDFYLDGLADSAEPSFQLEADEVTGTEQHVAQVELQLPLENPEYSKAELQLELDGMAKPIFAITLKSDTDEPQQLYFQNAPTLLESLEAQSIQVPYQCRDGYCGACRCKKIAGDVTYSQEPMAWINDDEILPCISIPTSNLILRLKG